MLHDRSDSSAGSSKNGSRRKRERQLLVAVLVLAVIHVVPVMVVPVVLLAVALVMLCGNGSCRRLRGLQGRDLPRLQEAAAGDGVQALPIREQPHGAGGLEGVPGARTQEQHRKIRTDRTKPQHRKVLDGLERVHATQRQQRKREEKQRAEG